MGMYQRKCVSCGKRRRFAEIKRTKPDKRWSYDAYFNAMICWVCTAARANLVSPYDVEDK